MKSYFLEATERPEAIPAVLTELLPGQTRPWVLLSPSGDAVAYFDIDNGDVVQADISGRHFSRDDAVLAVLAAVRDRVGGSITGDD